ncbi:TPA: hypothetical protein PTW06_000900 [Clostridium botulinum]|nr:hypothetical protein [Clostridium botulinum]HDK7223618.1 hypothetical protein [Clostridium botulinum]HDK7271050.1 hypothetical protein [Clostridium botulinum]HDK7304406.1 hypothetical protein [Clostridium botulinum]
MINFICKDCGIDYVSKQEKERCKKCEKARNNKLEQLNDYIIENLNMELMDNKITEVTKTIEGWEKVIKSEEFKNDNIESNLEIIEELKKYKGYDCLYSINYEYGGC